MNEQNRTVADAFFADPRVAQAKTLLLDAMREHQEGLAVRGPKESLKQSYDATLEAFATVRGGALYYPYLGSGFGNGALVELGDGSVKYDMITGIGVHFFGHNHPALVEAGIDAAVRNTVMQGNLQQNIESTRFSQMLLEAARTNGAALAHCFLSTSGAMANENALKIAFQKKAGATRVLAFENCFMGRTMALSQITDRANYRAGLPTTLHVDYVPFYDAREPEASTARAVAALRQHLMRYPGQHAAMCMELVQGEGGYYPGTQAFFLSLVEVLKQHEVAVLVDEVQTFGRLSRLFAFQHFGLDAHVDIVTIGKLSQVCATLFTDAFTPRPGLVSQTFTGSTASILAAQVIVQRMLSDNFFGADGRIERVHRRFVERFDAIQARHPGLVHGPYGAGGMVAFTPIDGTAATAKNVLHALYDRGVIAFVAGANPARIRFLPPAAVLTDEQIDEVCAIVEATLVHVAQTQGG